MAIDIKNLVELIQKKEHGVDSNTSMQDLLDILKAAQKAEGAVIRSYDSDGALPDAATSYERIAYMTNTKTLKFNNGAWDDPLLGAVSTAAGYTYQGSAFGYTLGSNSSPTGNIIEKHSYTADGNGTDVGDLSVWRGWVGGASSADNGYAIGGQGSPSAISAYTIDKHPFASDGNATDVGDTATYTVGTGASNDETHGYRAGSEVASASGGNAIERFPFATDENTTDVGDLSYAIRYSGGQSSTTNGYITGGYDSPPGSTIRNYIQKFPFAASTTTSDIGDLTVGRFFPAANSSSTHGYTAGGGSPSSQNIIDKFSFTSDGNATDVGDLQGAGSSIMGTSSTTHGFVQRSGNIDKYSFTSDANATAVGTAATSRGGLGSVGNQV